MITSVKKHYLKELRHEIGKINDVKRVFLSDIKTDVSDYLESNPNADFQALSNQFGQPDELAKHFFDLNDVMDLKKKARKYVILRVITVIMSLLIILFTADLIKDAIESKDHYIKVDNNFTSSVQ